MSIEENLAMARSAGKGALKIGVTMPSGRFAEELTALEQGLDCVSRLGEPPVRWAAQACP
jgi:hypothetical protein